MNLRDQDPGVYATAVLVLGACPGINAPFLSIGPTSRVALDVGIDQLLDATDQLLDAADFLSTTLNLGLLVIVGLDPDIARFLSAAHLPDALIDDVGRLLFPQHVVLNLLIGIPTVDLSGGVHTLPHLHTIHHFAANFGPLRCLLPIDQWVLNANSAFEANPRPGTDSPTFSSSKSGLFSRSIG